MDKESKKELITAASIVGIIFAGYCLVSTMDYQIQKQEEQERQQQEMQWQLKEFQASSSPADADSEYDCITDTECEERYGEDDTQLPTWER